MSWCNPSRFYQWIYKSFYNFNWKITSSKGEVVVRSDFRWIVLVTTTWTFDWSTFAVFLNIQFIYYNFVVNFQYLQYCLFCSCRRSLLTLIYIICHYTSSNKLHTYDFPQNWSTRFQLHTFYRSTAITDSCSPHYFGFISSVNQLKFTVSHILGGFPLSFVCCIPNAATI